MLITNLHPAAETAPNICPLQQLIRFHAVVAARCAPGRVRKTTSGFGGVPESLLISRDLILNCEVYDPAFFHCRPVNYCQAALWVVGLNLFDLDAVVSKLYFCPIMEADATDPLSLSAPSWWERRGVETVREGISGSR